MPFDEGKQGEEHSKVGSYLKTKTEHMQGPPLPWKWGKRISLWGILDSGMSEGLKLYSLIKTVKSILRWHIFIILVPGTWSQERQEFKTRLSYRRGHLKIQNKQSRFSRRACYYMRKRKGVLGFKLLCSQLWWPTLLIPMLVEVGESWSLRPIVLHS